MKKNKFKIVFFIFLAVFIAGIILLVIPFETENFKYSSVTHNTFTNSDKSGFNASISIDNESGKTKENVTITIKYVAEHMMDDYTETVVFNDIKLETGSNELKFRYEIEDFGIYRLEKIESVKLTFENGKTIEIGNSIFFASNNWYFLGMTIIGFFVSVVSFVLWKVAPKVEKGFEAVSDGIGNLGERIREAFKPLAQENAEREKDKKAYCSYCKCQFDAKLDKCPHCGAPPESKVD